MARISAFKRLWRAPPMNRFKRRCFCGARLDAEVLLGLTWEPRRGILFAAAFGHEGTKEDAP